MIRLVVLGQPETQGNKTGFVVGGRAILVEGKTPDARRRHKDWRAAVADAARQAREEAGRPELLDGPVVVRLTFALAKPASAPKRRRTWPIKARSGDIDKLARSCLDAITSTVLRDDSQVVGLLAVKDFGDPPGVVVEIEEVGPVDGEVDVWNLVPAPWPGMAEEVS